jgi:predicted esterase
MELLYTAHVPAGDGPFPTIIALHGWGANAHDLLGLAPIVPETGSKLIREPANTVTASRDDISARKKEGALCALFQLVRCMK